MELHTVNLVYCYEKILNLILIFKQKVLSRKYINSILEISYETRIRIIKNLYKELNHLKKNLDSFVLNLNNESIFNNIRLMSSLSTLKPTNDLLSTQANIIYFERCTECYNNICEKGQYCTDSIHLLHEIYTNSRNKELSTIIRIIYNIRLINCQLLDIDNALVDGDLRKLIMLRKSDLLDNKFQFILSKEEAEIVYVSKYILTFG